MKSTHVARLFKKQVVLCAQSVSVRDRIGIPPSRMHRTILTIKFVLIKNTRHHRTHAPNHQAFHSRFLLLQLNLLSFVFETNHQFRSAIIIPFIFGVLIYQSVQTGDLVIVDCLI